MSKSQASKSQDDASKSAAVVLQSDVAGPKSSSSSSSSTKSPPSSSSVVDSLFEKEPTVVPYTIQLQNTCDQHGIFGQNLALTTLSDKINKLQHPMRWVKKTVHTLLLSGPTSCGKTEICEHLIKTLGLWDDHHVWFDFSNMPKQEETLGLVLGGTSVLSRRLLMSEQLYKEKNGGGAANQLIRHVAVFDNFQKAKQFVREHLLGFFEKPVMDYGEHYGIRISRVLVICIINPEDKANGIPMQVSDAIAARLRSGRIDFLAIEPTFIPRILKHYCKQFGLKSVPLECKVEFDKLCTGYKKQYGVRDTVESWEEALSSSKAGARLSVSDVKSPPSRRPILPPSLAPSSSATAATSAAPAAVTVANGTYPVPNIYPVAPDTILTEADLPPSKDTLLPGEPRRWMNKYICFSQHQTKLSPGNVLAGNETFSKFWYTMTPDEKRPYATLSTKLRLAHDQWQEAHPAEAKQLALAKKAKLDAKLAAAAKLNAKVAAAVKRKRKPDVAEKKGGAKKKVDKLTKAKSVKRRRKSNSDTETSSDADADADADAESKTIAKRNTRPVTAPDADVAELRALIKAAPRGAACNNATDKVSRLLKHPPVMAKLVKPPYIFQSYLVHDLLCKCHGKWIRADSGTRKDAWTAAGLFCDLEDSSILKPLACKRKSSLPPATAQEKVELLAAMHALARPNSCTSTTIDGKVLWILQQPAINALFQRGIFSTRDFKDAMGQVFGSDWLPLKQTSSGIWTLKFSGDVYDKVRLTVNRNDTPQNRIEPKAVVHAASQTLTATKSLSAATTLTPVTKATAMLESDDDDNDGKKSNSDDSGKKSNKSLSAATTLTPVAKVTDSDDDDDDDKSHPKPLTLASRHKKTSHSSPN